MFKVWLTNFHYFINNDQGFDSVEQAIEAGKKTGFEFTVHADHPVHNQLVAYHTTFSGTTRY